MGIKITERYLNGKAANKVVGKILYSGAYAITMYVIPKNGILTVVPNFLSKEEIHSCYIVLEGDISVRNENNKYVCNTGDAIELDNDIPYFLIESLDGAKILSIEQGTSTYVQDITTQIKDKLDSIDSNMAHDSIDVMRVANDIAKNLPWEIDLNKLSKAALIHDIGKTEIDRNILNKPGKLTEQEFEIIKQHPEKSLKYMVGSFDDPIIRDAVIEHHERLDGSGYPRGLKDNDISREAKVLMVADMFSALTNKRSFRHSFSEEEAYEIIKNDCNKNKLDKDVVLALRKAINNSRFNKDSEN